MAIVWAGSSFPLWRVTPTRHRVSSDPSLPAHSMTARGKQKEHSPTCATKQSTPRAVSNLYYSCPQCGKGDVPAAPGPYLCDVCGRKCKED